MPELKITSDYTQLFGIPILVFNIISIIIEILFFSTPFVFFNIILWSVRLIVFIEILPYIKSLLHPLTT